MNESSVEQPVLEGCIRAVRTGEVRVQQWGGREISTGAAKSVAVAPVRATATGLIGDAQGNLRVHGGPEKAICCYAAEHYAQWRADGIELPDGALFENLTLEGVVDADVHLGDVFELGRIRVQVTQPRRPCTTVSARWERRELPRLMQDRGRVGYYLRVLVEGEIAAGDRMHLIERLPNSVSVAEVNRIMNVDRTDREGIARLLASPELPERWRATLERRLAGELEDDSARLGT
ncbi:MOSC domain-containing protein [Gulosibacter macacae]|uniref:MOSC domain-containing protein n=1 Tax=Gulosibacter macacae TaxID=2488791 RepID=UPI001F2FA90B|nr:MOSC domain-containing protein [Gulosibacter macacae]